mmetsp:Transcript_32395/g.103051  ORF Transcript_32395/g.103051 Transcript_32395/m.103051 type:complete len:158 (-) Transcript_32395:104-577(-)
MAAMSATICAAPAAGARVCSAPKASSAVLATPFAGKGVNFSTHSIAGSALKVERGSSVVVMMKKGIHPEFHPEAKVFCNGEEVISMGGTKPEYVVDVWSGNHPFFQDDSGGVMVVDEGRVNRFKRMYDGLGELSNVATINDKANKDKADKAAAEKAE